MGMVFGYGIVIKPHPHPTLPLKGRAFGPLPYS